MKRALVALCAIGGAVVMPYLTVAQSYDFDVSVFGSSLTIDISPQSPRPGDAVRMQARASGIELADSLIEWVIDGKILKQGVGADSIDLAVGSLGSQTRVNLNVQTSSGSQRFAEAIIAPTELDLLVSSDSYTPPFYRGRALPSVGSNIIVQAKARFLRTDGSAIPDSQITFTWSRNDEVLGSISGRGRSTAVIPMQHVFGTDSIEVTASSADNLRTGSARVVVPRTDPVLVLYEDNSRYGILYNRALSDTADIKEIETGFAAVPFFAPVQSPNDTRLAYKWRVNGVEIPASTASPSSITINADDSDRIAGLALRISHDTNLYFDASGLWTLHFTGSRGADDPFTTGL